MLHEVPGQAEIGLPRLRWRGKADRVEYLRRAVTLEDVASAAGVSTATVSLVVRARDGVRPRTRERVQRAIDELGYIPNGLARGLSNQRKEIIGLVAEEQRDDSVPLDRRNVVYRDEVLYGVEEALRREHWSLLISFMSNSDVDAIQSLLSKIDGLVAVIGTVEESILEQLAKRIPLVVVAGGTERARFDVVAADNAGGMRALLDHLIVAHGYRSFTFVGGPDYAPDARERQRVFDAVMQAAGTSVVGRFHGSFVAQTGTDAAISIMKSALPDVVVCANDPLAIAVMAELQSHGIRVPDDVAVVGFDDIAMAAYASPALTTVRQPIRELGATAARVLLQRIDDPERDLTVETLPTTVVIRASCGCEAGRPGQPE